jgi:hypothetical protein
LVKRKKLSNITSPPNAGAGDPNAGAAGAGAPNNPPVGAGAVNKQVIVNKWYSVGLFDTSKLDS